MRQAPSGSICPRAEVPWGDHAVPGGASNQFQYVVPGAKPGMSVIATPETANGLGPLLIAYSAVSAHDQVTVTYFNPNETAVQPTEIMIIVCLPID